MLSLNSRLLSFGESKIIYRFSTVRGSVPLTLMLFKGQLNYFLGKDLLINLMHTEIYKVHKTHYILQILSTNA